MYIYMCMYVLQVMSSMGFTPLRAMVREALSAVDTFANMKSN